MSANRFVVSKADEEVTESVDFNNVSISEKFENSKVTEFIPNVPNENEFQNNEIEDSKYKEDNASEITGFGFENTYASVKLKHTNFHESNVSSQAEQ